jgi:hypothetical protein
MRVTTRGHEPSDSQSRLGQAAAEGKPSKGDGTNGNDGKTSNPKTFSTTARDVRGGIGGRLLGAGPPAHRSRTAQGSALPSVSSNGNRRMVSRVSPDRTQ